MVVFKGLKDAPQSEASILVSDYCNRVAMKKLGYQIDLSKMTQFEIESFTLIASEFARLQNERNEQSREKSKKTRGK